MPVLMRLSNERVDMLDNRLQYGVCARAIEKRPGHWVVYDPTAMTIYYFDQDEFGDYCIWKRKRNQNVEIRRAS